MTTEPTPHDPIPAEPETASGRYLLDMIERLRQTGMPLNPSNVSAVRGYLLGAEREARASLAAENAELREAGDRMVRECMAVVRTLDRQHAHVRSARSDLQTAVGWFAETLASPSPSADYAARLRREGAEAALDVERIAAALHATGECDNWTPAWEMTPDEHDAAHRQDAERPSCRHPRSDRGRVRC